MQGAQGTVGTVVRVDVVEAPVAQQDDETCAQRWGGVGESEGGDGDAKRGEHRARDAVDEKEAATDRRGA